MWTLTRNPLLFSYCLRCRKPVRRVTWTNKITKPLCYKILSTRFSCSVLHGWQNPTTTHFIYSWTFLNFASEKQNSSILCLCMGVRFFLKEALRIQSGKPLHLRPWKTSRITKSKLPFNFSLKMEGNTGGDLKLTTEYSN